MTRIDRRALFTSGAAAALLAATGVSLAAAPKPGGRLRIAVPRDGSLENLARGAGFDTLTEVAPDGVLRGELATDWHGSADARDWRFDLDPQACFHDGTGLTAADVAASLAARYVPVLAGARIVAETPQRLRIVLSQGNPDLPILLADPALVVARAGAVDLPPDRAAGSGLYRIARMQDGRNLLARKVAGHPRSGRAGWVDSIEAVVIPDARVRAEALCDGFVDVAALPWPQGLRGRGEFFCHPGAQDMALAVRRGVGVPRTIGSRAPLDDWRIAERWWIA